MPMSGKLYHIVTFGEYFNLTCCWNVEKKAYLIVGKTNLKSLMQNSQYISFGGENVYTPNANNYNSYQGNVFTLPVKFGDVLSVNLKGVVANYVKINVGFAGDSTVSTQFYTTSTRDQAWSYVKEIEINDHLASLNTPFRIHVSTPGYSGQHWQWSGTIVHNDGYGGYQTTEYVGPSKYNDAQAGLVPVCKKGSENLILFSDGQWHTIQELKELIDSIV